MTAFQKSLAIREKLASMDPGNAQWQVDLARSLGSVHTLHATGDAKAIAMAKEGLQRALKIVKQLEAENRLANTDRPVIDDLQRELAKLDGEKAPSK